MKLLITLFIYGMVTVTAQPISVLSFTTTYDDEFSSSQQRWLESTSSDSDSDLEYEYDESPQRSHRRLLEYEGPTASPTHFLDVVNSPIDIVTILNAAPSNHTFMVRANEFIVKLEMYKTTCPGDTLPVAWMMTPLVKSHTTLLATNLTIGSSINITVQVNSTIAAALPVVINDTDLVAPVIPGCIMFNATTILFNTTSNTSEPPQVVEFTQVINSIIKTNCTIGSSSSTGYNYPTSCEECEYGSHQGTRGQTSCIPCPDLDPYTSSQTGSTSPTQCQPSPLGTYSPLGELLQLCPPYGYETNPALPSRTVQSCENLPCSQGYFCGSGAAIPVPGAKLTDPGYVPPQRRMSLMVQVPAVETIMVVKSQKAVTLTVINLDSTRDIRIGFGSVNSPVYVQGIQGVPTSSPAVTWPIVKAGTTSSGVNLVINAETLPVDVQQVSGTFPVRWCVVGTETELFDMVADISVQVVKILMSPLTFDFQATISKNGNVTISGPVPKISIYNTLCNAPIAYNVRQPALGGTCNGPIPSWFTYATPSGTSMPKTVFDLATIEDQRGTPDEIGFSLQFNTTTFLSADRGNGQAVSLSYCFTVDIQLIGLDASFSQDFTVSALPLIPCPPGSFSSDGFNEHGCTPCGFNQYQPDSQQTSCLPCPSQYPNTLGNGTALLLDCKAGPKSFENPDRTISSCTDSKYPQNCMMCNEPGLTLQALPLRKRCWRLDQFSDDIRPCIHSQYCRGGTFSLPDGAQQQQGRRVLAAAIPAPSNFYLSPNASAMCVPNHMGILCEACVPGTYKRGIQQLCEPCHAADIEADAGRIAGLFLGIIFGSVALVVFIYYVRKLHSLRAQRYSVRIPRAHVMMKNIDSEVMKSRRMEKFGEAIDLGVKLKIIVGLLQVIGSMSITFASTLPPFFTQVANLYKLMALDVVSVVDFGCTMNLSTQKASLLVTTLMPIGVILVLAFLHIMMERFLGLHKEQTTVDLETKKEFRTVSFTIFLVILFLCYPSVASKLLESFHCETYAGTVLALAADPSVICSGPDFDSIVAYAACFTLIYVVGIPFFFYWVLYQHKDQINPHMDHQLESRLRLTLALATRAKDRRIMHLRFLYKPYKPRFWAFEVFELGRKLVQTSIVVFLPANSTSQILFQLGVTFVAVVIFNGWKPYVLKSNSALAMASQWVIFFISFITLLLQLDINHSTYNTDVLDTLLVLLFCTVPVMAVAQLFVELSEENAYRKYLFFVNWKKMEEKFPRFFSKEKEQGSEHEEEEGGEEEEEDPERHRAMSAHHKVEHHDGDKHEGAHIRIKENVEDITSPVDKNPLFNARAMQLKERIAEALSECSQERAKARVLQQEVETLGARNRELNRELEAARVREVKTENLLDEQIAATGRAVAASSITSPAGGGLPITQRVWRRHTDLNMSTLNAGGGGGGRGGRSSVLGLVGGDDATRGRSQTQTHQPSGFATMDGLVTTGGEATTTTTAAVTNPVTAPRRRRTSIFAMFGGV